MTHIDQLAHIQSCVRNGEKWEYLSKDTSTWISDRVQTVERLNEYVAGHYQVRLVPQPRYWSKPEDVPGPVCWIRWCDGAVELVTAIRNDGLCVDSKYWHWSHFTCVEHSTDLKVWKSCTVEQNRIAPKPACTVEER